MVEAARSRVPGPSRRVRFCLSHESGKIEIVGTDDRSIYVRYHRAKHSEDTAGMIFYRRDDDACWVDQLVPVLDV